MSRLQGKWRQVRLFLMVSILTDPPLVQGLAQKLSHAEALERPIRQVAEAIRLNAALLARNAQPIREWLERNAF